MEKKFDYNNEECWKRLVELEQRTNSKILEYDETMKFKSDTVYMKDFVKGESGK